MNNPWIFESFRKDMAFLYLPAFLGLLIAIFMPTLGDDSVIYALLIAGVLDSGHAYTTWWRTFLNKEERQSSRKYYLYAPLVIFFFFLAWSYSEIPGIWSFAVYAFFYHHVRQVYGFSKWYQYLNRSYRKTSDYFLYALMALPLVIYHFRDRVLTTYYTPNNLFSYPNPQLQHIFTLIYSFVAMAWILYEVSIWKKGARELNRFLSILLPGLVFAYCFLVGRTITDAIFPFLILHAAAYFAIMGQSLHRTQKQKFQSFGKAITIVIFTAAFFGLSESFFEENILGHQFNQVLVFAFYLTPLFVHYYHDAIIWKRRHREGDLNRIPSQTSH